MSSEAPSHGEITSVPEAKNNILGLNFGNVSIEAFGFVEGRGGNSRLGVL